MTASARRLGFATVLLAFAAPFSAGQDVGGGSAPLPTFPGGTASEADILRRLAAQLGGGTANIPDLAKLIEQFGKGGKVDKVGLEEQLKKLTQSDQKKLYDQLMKDFGGKLPSGLKLPDGVKTPEDVTLPELPRSDRLLPKERMPFSGSGPPPKGDPFGGLQPDPLAPGGFRPPAANLPSDPAAKEAIEFWEKNVGSLNEMPAVRDALVAIATSGLDSAGGKSFLDDLMKDGSLDPGGPSAPSSGFFKWLNENSSGWSLGAGGGGSGWTPPGSSWGGSSSGAGFGPPSAEGLGAVGIVFLAVVVAAAVGLFFWKVLPVIREGRSPRPLPGHGPWPVDPRAIRTREQLVTAFEYLSVLECGDRAKVWNHVAIADGLRAAVPDSAPYADALARIYAQARYTPEAEPLSDATVAEARGYLCRLAGVSPA